MFCVRGDCETKKNRSSAVGGATTYRKKNGIDGKVILWGNFWPQKKGKFPPLFTQNGGWMGQLLIFFQLFLLWWTFTPNFCMKVGKTGPNKMTANSSPFDWYTILGAWDVRGPVKNPISETLTFWNPTEKSRFVWGKNRSVLRVNYWSYRVGMYGEVGWDVE